jgi:hypothetical protein
MMKICTKCEQELPATDMYFNRDKRGGEGKLRSVCKDCYKKQSKEYRDETTERARQYGNQYRQEHKEEVNERHRRHYQEHKERINERQKQYNKEHREGILKYSKQYSKEHKEEIAERMKRYNEEHKEERQHSRKQYRKTPHGKMVVRVHNHRRRALKRNLGGSHTAQELKDQMNRQKSKCFYCKKKINKNDKWHADHIVPLSKGGTDNIENIVIACPTCNLRKHANLWTLF